MPAAADDHEPTASPSSEPAASSYFESVDLTTRGQKQAERESGQFLQEPDPALDATTAEDLPDIVYQAFRAMGWTELMPVQQKAIPYLLGGRELIVQARTGTGKTGAFLLPLFEVLEAEQRHPQVLILAPTRELARQIHHEFEQMKLATAATNELDAALIYGGVSYEPQLKALRGGAQVIIGTPGRILDHLESGNFSLEQAEMFVLDEADEMLSMGFYPAMQDIKEHLPDSRKSYMFSATVPAKVRSLGREFLDDPGFLSLSSGHESVEDIDHRYYLVGKMDKDRALLELIEHENPDSALIFCNTKREVRYLAQFLQNQGQNADQISGDLSQNDREHAMQRIRDGELRFLVATDVAARGIDITDLSHVFIYDIPQDREYYIHRSGRTARAGQTGVAITLATVEDEHELERAAQRYGVDLRRCELPSEEEVEERVDERLTVELEERRRHLPDEKRERMERFLPLAKELAAEEPELFAMLLDDVYVEHVQHAPAQPDPDAEELEEKAGPGANGAA
ncbi:MAG: ATP-dependent helicase [Bacteroidetes bacterium QS_8_68_15]|nr:MAG: ATP-dependent helicase [Bacteroidetes bacterium QS_8_68_15]